MSRTPFSRRVSDGGGFTMIELTVAILLSLFVVLALGKIILASQRSWEWGRDKAVLQQNDTEVLEWMSRSVRAARTLRVVSSSELRTYDEGNNLAHTFKLATVSGVPKLQQDGIDMTPRKCTQFVVTPDPDTTSVQLTVELEDKAGNRVAAMTRPAIRNRFFEY